MLHELRELNVNEPLHSFKGWSRHAHLASPYSREIHRICAVVVRAWCVIQHKRNRRVWQADSCIWCIWTNWTTTVQQTYNTFQIAPNIRLVTMRHQNNNHRTWQEIPQLAAWLYCDVTVIFLSLRNTISAHPDVSPSTSR